MVMKNSDHTLRVEKLNKVLLTLIAKVIKFTVDKSLGKLS